MRPETLRARLCLLRRDSTELKGKYKKDRVRRETQVPDKWASIKPQQPHRFAVVCSVNQKEMALLLEFYTGTRGGRQKSSLPPLQEDELP
jgi:hypothetical protein